MYGPHLPICTPNIWSFSWWDSGWFTGGSPSRPGSGFLDSLWCYLAAIHKVPEAVNWIWGMWGPASGINALIIQDTLATRGQALSSTGGTQGSWHQHKVWQWAWRFYLSTQQLSGYYWRARRDPPRICLHRSPLPHCQTGHAGRYCRQHISHHDVSRLFHICHMCSEWTCSHLWRQQNANGGPASSDVVWQMAI